jgi:hypothetical protein
MRCVRVLRENIFLVMRINDLWYIVLVVLCQLSSPQSFVYQLQHYLLHHVPLTRRYYTQPLLFSRYTDEIICHTCYIYFYWLDIDRAKRRWHEGGGDTESIKVVGGPQVASIFVKILQCHSKSFGISDVSSSSCNRVVFTANSYVHVNHSLNHGKSQVVVFMHYISISLSLLRQKKWTDKQSSINTSFFFLLHTIT